MCRAILSMSLFFSGLIFSYRRQGGWTGPFHISHPGIWRCHTLPPSLPLPFGEALVNTHYALLLSTGFQALWTAARAQPDTHTHTPNTPSTTPHIQHTPWLTHITYTHYTTCTHTLPTYTPHTHTPHTCTPHTHHTTTHIQHPCTTRTLIYHTHTFISPWSVFTSVPTPIWSCLLCLCFHLHRKVLEQVAGVKTQRRERQQVCWWIFNKIFPQPTPLKK